MLHWITLARILARTHPHRGPRHSLWQQLRLCSWAGADIPGKPFLLYFVAVVASASPWAVR
jgi:hypothetical protein